MEKEGAKGSASRRGGGVGGRRGGEGGSAGGELEWSGVGKGGEGRTGGGRVAKKGNDVIAQLFLAKCVNLLRSGSISFEIWFSYYDTRFTRRRTIRILLSLNMNRLEHLGSLVGTLENALLFLCSQ